MPKRKKSKGRGGNSHDRAMARSKGRFMPKPQTPTTLVASVPFYESTLLWGAFGIVITLVSVYLGFALKDIRWFLAAAFPFCVLTFIGLAKPVHTKKHQHVYRGAVIVVGAAVSGFSLWKIAESFPPPQNLDVSQQIAGALNSWFSRREQNHPAPDVRPENSGSNYRYTPPMRPAGSEGHLAEGDLIPEFTPHPMLGRVLEIGPHGTILRTMNTDSTDNLTFFYDAGLKVEDNLHGPLLSTPVRDREGHLVVEVTRNHWRVYPNYSTDWNYNQHSLEVKDSGGHVILQVHLFRDRVQIQGEWHDQFGRGGRLMKVPDKSESSTAIWPNLQAEDRFKELILPMFSYPASDHLGRLVTQQ